MAGAGRLRFMYLTVSAYKKYCKKELKMADDKNAWLGDAASLLFLWHSPSLLRQKAGVNKLIQGRYSNKLLFSQMNSIQKDKQYFDFRDRYISWFNMMGCWSSKHCHHILIEQKWVYNYHYWTPVSI